MPTSVREREQRGGGGGLVDSADVGAPKWGLAARDWQADYVQPFSPLVNTGTDVKLAEVDATKSRTVATV